MLEPKKVKTVYAYTVAFILGLPVLILQQRIKQCVKLFICSFIER